MSTKAALDSDIYGDIYGEDENEFAVPLHEGAEEAEDVPSVNEDEQEIKVQEIKTRKFGNTVPSEPSLKALGGATSAATSSRSGIGSSPTQSDGSLPAKPPSPNSSTSSNSMSYSAQIAQQFSSYQQTPSQERQQRQPASKTVAPPSGDSVFGKKPSEMHDAGKMFIGGLNWDTTDEGLRDYFSQFGKVDACTIMRDPNGTSRGFAFLTFEDPNAVTPVVGRDHFLDGKQIDPKRAIPREEHLRNTRYFVGGLAPNTTAESMKEFFSQYGKVVDTTVMVDRESGRSKGFGFVTFEDASNTDQLVGKTGLMLDDKQIEVKMAQPRSQREQNRNMVQNQGILTEVAQSRNAPMNIPFTPQQVNPMAMMLQRGMNQMPMMGAGMPMMGMNPMAMMGMGMGMGGMNGMNGMMGGMMGGGMAGMGSMSGMANMAPMRMGMGPMAGAAMGVGGMGAMGNMGMGMRAGMSGMGVNRVGMNAGGPGPARLSTRGQHSFHPYGR